MKNYAKKLCSLCTILSVTLFTIVIPGIFSTSTFAASISNPLGTIEVPKQEEIRFPEKCEVVGSDYNITYTVSALNKLTSFLIRAVNYDNTFNPNFLSDSINGTAEVKFTPADKLCIFKVFNNDEKDTFTGSLKVEGELPIQVDCSQTSSSTSYAISSVFVAVITGITALFS